MKLKFLFLLLMLQTTCFATHMVGAYISMQHISGYTYEVSYVSLTNAGPLIQPDRCWMTIYFSDGDSLHCDRVNGLPGSCSGNATMGVIIANGYKYNIYKGIKTFNNPGIYRAWAQDANRSDGIINIPGSVNIPLYINSLVTVVDPNLYCPVSTADLGAFPIINNDINLKYTTVLPLNKTHGDSISYSIDTCRNSTGNTVIGYSFPNGLSLNPVTGKLNIDSLSAIGNYNLALRINSWRNNILISYVTIDFMITVSASNTVPLNIPIVTNLQQNSDSVFVGNFQSTDSIIISYNNPSSYQVYLYSDIHDSLITSSNNGAFNQIKILNLAPLVRKQAYKLILRTVNNPMSTNVAKDYLFYFTVGNSNSTNCTLPLDLGISAKSVRAVTCFPNPASTFIIVNEAQGKLLKLYDITGNVLMQQRISAHQEYVNVEGLENGMYIVDIEGNTMKLIKN